MTDIVAELDRWIRSGFDGSLIRDLMQRARNEILALREHEAGGTIRANSSTISTARSFALKFLGSISGFKNPDDHTTEWFERAMAAGRAEERERCAQIVEFIADTEPWGIRIATAIRKEPS
jgi:hypothetical protein